MTPRNMEILEIKVKTNNSENTLDLGKDLAIDMANINESFCEQPALYAYWATVYSQAKYLADRKKLEVERQEEYLKKTLIGELDVEVRQELEMNGEKVTESKVTNGIYVHDRYKEELAELYALREELLELQNQVTTLCVAKDAMNQKKDALISLGAQLRQEVGNVDVSLNDLSAKAKSVVNSKK